MALDRLYYAWANAALDDTSTALLVRKSHIWAIYAFLTQQKTGTTGTSGAPPGSAAWTLRLSSDGVSAGAANYWLAAFGTGAQILHGTGAGVAKSWAVFTSPTNLTSSGGVAGAGTGTAFELLVAFDGTTNTGYSLTLANTAFTGGSATNVPTSVDATNRVVVTIADTTAAAGKASFITDARGNWRMDVCRSTIGYVHTVVGVSEFVDADVGDLFPVCVFGDSDVAARGSPQSGCPWFSAGGAVSNGHGIQTRAPLNNFVCGNGTGCGIMVPPNTNWFTGSAVTQLFSTVEVMAAKYWWIGASAANVAYKGKLPNWWISNRAKASGTVDPPSGASELIHHSQIWLPNGGVAQTL